MKIAKLRESGKPISAIATEYGIVKSTISKWHHDCTSIANDTAASLQQSVEGAKKVTETIDRISQASAEQAQSIAQIPQGIEQLS